MNNEGQNAQPIQGAGAAAAANNQMVNQLETIFSNPKADIPVFYGDITILYPFPPFFGTQNTALLTAKFLHVQIPKFAVKTL
jgi:hypothetical protein